MTFADFISKVFTGPSIALIATTLTAALAGWGSAKAVGSVGTVVAGVLTEDPAKYGKLLILQALPGTQGIYGLIVWFIYMIFSGTMTGAPKPITPDQGWMIFAACLPMMIVGFFSAVHQGRVAAAGCSLVAKRPEEQSKAIVLAAMVETYAIFALLVSILTIIFVL